MIETRYRSFFPANFRAEIEFSLGRMESRGLRFLLMHARESLRIYFVLFLLPLFFCPDLVWLQLTHELIIIIASKNPMDGFSLRVLSRLKDVHGRAHQLY